MKAFVYILQSQANGRYYLGSTDNLSRRLEEHARGKSRYSRLTRPFVLVFSQAFESLHQARLIENKLKRFKRRDILERIIQEGFIRITC